MFHVVIERSERHINLQATDLTLPMIQLSVEQFLLQFRVEIGINGVLDCHRAVVMAARTRHLFFATFAHKNLYFYSVAG